jgi:hypothetical protein
MSTLAAGSIERSWGGTEAALAHLAWVNEASSTDLSNHLLSGHGLSVGGNMSFKKKTHAYLHASEHGQLV